MQVSSFSPKFSAPKSDVGVSADLAGEVKKELGDSVLLGLGGEKIDTLQRFFSEAKSLSGSSPRACWVKAGRKRTPMGSLQRRNTVSRTTPTVIFNN